MTKKQMRSEHKTLISDIRSGKMPDSQLKLLTQGLAIQVKYGRDEILYKKVTHSKKTIPLYE